MQDKSENGALLAIHKQIIREKREGLAHVEAFVALCGVHMPAVPPAKRKDVAGKGFMTAIVLDALNDGPKHLQQIVAHMAAQRPQLDPEFAYGRTVRVLVKMKRHGLLRSAGQMGCSVGLWARSVFVATGLDLLL